MGFVPALVSVFLVSKLGETRAKELLYSGDLISAAQAEKIGLINQVIDAHTIEEEVRLFATKLCKNASTNSLMVTKDLLVKNYKPQLDQQLDEAARVNAMVRSSDDFKNGIAAFLNKESIVW